MAESDNGKKITGIGKVEDAGPASSRGPWTAEEEEAISVLMELMPLLAEANAAVKQKRYRREGGPHDASPQAG